MTDTDRPVVLIAEELSPATVEALGPDFEIRSCNGADRAELLPAIADVDAILVRSATKVDEEALTAARRLKVVARAGVGLDNVDVRTATQNGVMVVNAPTSNIVSAAELAVALMLAAARHVSPAHAALKNGEWKRSKYTGIELYEKTVGIVGLGRIGVLVAQRLSAFGMNVIAFDPYVQAGRAAQMGVRLVELDTLLAEADFMSVHLPKTPETVGLIGADELARAKPSLVLVNAARGGIVDEEALYDALKTGRIAGAGLDVFASEPCTDSPLFELENVVATPHLGASTNEAQVNVALQVAEQIADFLVHGGVTNALNMPSLSAEEAPKLKPYMALAEKLGSLVGQLTTGSIPRISIHTEGAAAELNAKPIVAAVLAGFLRTQSDTVNMVNAPFLAKERGLEVREVKTEKEGDYHTLIRVSVKTDAGERSVAGTLFANSEPRLVELFGIKVEAELAGPMMYIVNEDAPGFIGRIGTLMGESAINIGTFNLGRREAGGEAVLLLSVDSPVPAVVIDKARAVPGVKRVMALAF